MRACRHRALSVEDRDEMAKALLGHVGVPQDVRLIAEVARLRARVRELEAELASAHADRDRMVGVPMSDDELLRLSELEHAGV